MTMVQDSQSFFKSNNQWLTGSVFRFCSIFTPSMLHVRYFLYVPVISIAYNREQARNHLLRSHHIWHGILWHALYVIPTSWATRNGDFSSQRLAIPKEQELDRKMKYFLQWGVNRESKSSNIITADWWVDTKICMSQS